MSKYTRRIAVQTEFDGDTVTCSIARLSRADMLALTSMIDFSKADEDGTPCPEDNQRMLAAAIDMLPGYVGDTLAGLTDCTGQALLIQDVVNEAYFLPLATDLAARLINSAQISEDDVKNLSAPPNTLSVAQVTSEAGA